MKVIDRYIIRELAAPILFCSLSLIGLILVADIFDNLDEFLRYKTPASVIFKYYGSLIPYAFVQTIPWATWLGTLFLLINFGFHSEFLAMKVAGLKIATIIRPILFCGFLIGIITFIVGDRVVPKTFKTATELSEIYIEKKSTREEGKIVKNVTYRSIDNQLYYFREIALGKAEAKDAVILWLDKNSGKTRQKISASSAKWTGEYWEFTNITEHQVDARGRILGEPRSYPIKAYKDLQVAPDDIANASRDSVFLTYREMKDSMKKLNETGVDTHGEMVDLQYRLASPWQSLVMMLIVIPLLGPTRTRKGIAAAVLVCIGLVFTFFVSGAVGLALGKSGILFPFLSAWAGNILFAVLALLNLDRANF